MFLLPFLALVAGQQAEPRPVPIEPGGWIDTADYPPDALRRGATGTVAFVLKVDESGLPVTCTVTASSGDASLDAATCSQLQAHARFRPPLDSRQQPLSSTFKSRVVWQLPETAALAAAPARGPAAPASPIRIGGLGTGFAAVKPLAPVAPQAAANCKDDARAAADPATPDPALRSGILPNGLRYFILCKATGTPSVSFRFRIAGGSLVESEQERGFAHLVEHMVFRGSKNNPDGQLLRSLQTIGIRPGDGSTATTSYDETIYSLDYPPGASAIDSGLDVMREVADRALIAPATLPIERDVVSAEGRLRDTPEGRLEDSRLAFLLEGQRAPTRSPIGTPASLAGASAAAVHQFYQRNYRPDKAILVIVGPLNASVVEDKIRRGFGDWKAVSPAPATPDLGKVMVRGEQAHLVVQPGMPERLELSWVSPFAAVPDTEARQRHDLQRDVAVQILNERLAQLADTPDPTVAFATAGTTALFSSAKITGIQIVPLAGRESDAVAAVLREQKRLLQFGSSGAEIGRAVASMRSELAAASTLAPAMSSASVAASLLATVAGGDPYHSNAQRLAIFDRDAPNITPDDLRRAATELFVGSGPLLFVSRSSAQKEGERGLQAALVLANHEAATEAASASTPAWPYTGFGKPGKVTARETIADLDVTFVRFANGTSLTVKQALGINTILVDLNFGAGYAGLPTGLERAYWLLGTSAFLDGGLRKARASDVERQLGGKRISLAFTATEDRFHLIGETRAEDLDGQLQLLTAYIADPAMSAGAVARAQAVMRTTTAQFDTSVIMRAQRDLPFLLHDRDRRWLGVPDAADLAAVEPADLAALLSPSLAGPLNLVMVGNVPIERAIAAAAATIGALPRRGPRPEPRPVSFASGSAPIAVRIDNGRSDQGVAIAAWPTPGFFSFPTMADSRGVQVLAELAQERLTTGLREADGLTYAPTIFLDQSEVFPAFGVIGAEVEIAPDKFDRFYATLSAITIDLAKNPVSVDELERIQNPLVEESRRMLAQTNYWLGALTTANDDRRQLDVIRTREQQLFRVSPAEIQRLARLYTRGAPPLRITFSQRAPVTAKPN